ncbi:hypothetical protein C0Q70_03904 [Pomacea canaliculata]|uniref:Uncharacterized protein n=1 Tax=Pomacea canaliculata TaxID=400727 RepID=A0A2T7PU06_POMCA|nr:hypothetical protein C0Q70_03904 [Pomacea canaliculata]
MRSIWLTVHANECPDMGLLDVPYQIYIFVAKLFGLFFLFVHGIAFRMWNYGIKPALSKEDAKSLGDVSAMASLNTPRRLRPCFAVFLKHRQWPHNHVLVARSILEFPPIVSNSAWGYYLPLPVMAFVLWWNLMIASVEAIFRPLNVTIARFSSLLWGHEDPERSNKCIFDLSSQCQARPNISCVRQVRAISSRAPRVDDAIKTGVDVTE